VSFFFANRIGAVAEDDDRGMKPRAGIVLMWALSIFDSNSERL
jgi:hypothetical protein